jgi:hypothetical protein
MIRRRQLFLPSWANFLENQNRQINLKFLPAATNADTRNEPSRNSQALLNSRRPFDNLFAAQYGEALFL